MRFKCPSGPLHKFPISISTSTCGSTLLPHETQLSTTHSFTVLSLPQPHLVIAFTQDLSKLLHKIAPKHSPHPRAPIVQLFYSLKLVENSFNSIFGPSASVWVVHGHAVYSKTRSPTSSFFFHLHESRKWDLSFHILLGFLTALLYPHHGVSLDFQATFQGLAGWNRPCSCMWFWFRLSSPVTK